MAYLRTAFNAFKEVEKRMHYRFGHKEQERSARAAVMADRGAFRPSCPLNHDRWVWSGPPHHSILTYTCCDCGAYATEDMIKDMGFEFGAVLDLVVKDLMDEQMKARFKRGDPVLFLPSGVSRNGR